MRLNIGRCNQLKLKQTHPHTNLFKNHRFIISTHHNNHAFKIQKLNVSFHVSHHHHHHAIRNALKLLGRHARRRVLHLPRRQEHPILLRNAERQTLHPILFTVESNSQSHSLHDPRLRLRHWLALPENLHQLRHLGLRRLRRRSPRPRQIRRPPLLPRRHGENRRQFPIFLPPHPQQRAVQTPPSFPLRRVHGWSHSYAHVLPISAGRVDGPDFLGPALRHAGKHET